MTERIRNAVPTPEVVRERVEAGRTFNRRRLALKYTARVAGGQQVRQYDADNIVGMAKKFDEFLRGDR